MFPCIALLHCTNGIYKVRDPTNQFTSSLPCAWPAFACPPCCQLAAQPLLFVPPTCSSSLLPTSFSSTILSFAGQIPRSHVNSPVPPGRGSTSRPRRSTSNTNTRTRAESLCSHPSLRHTKYSVARLLISTTLSQNYACTSAKTLHSGLICP